MREMTDTRRTVWSWALLVLNVTVSPLLIWSFFWWLLRSDSMPIRIEHLVLCAVVGLSLVWLAILTLAAGLYRDHMSSPSGHVARANLQFSLAVVIFGGFLGFLAIPGVHRGEGRQAACLSNVKQLSVAMLMYAQDHGDRFPDPDRWNELIELYLKDKKAFFCLSERNMDVPSYGMNRALGGLRKTSLVEPSMVVLLFDSVPGKNQNGGTELLPSPARHKSAQVIGFADGHVKRCTDEMANRLRWKP